MPRRSRLTTRRRSRRCGCAERPTWWQCLHKGQHRFLFERKVATCLIWSLPLTLLPSLACCPAASPCSWVQAFSSYLLIAWVSTNVIFVAAATILSNSTWESCAMTESEMAVRGAGHHGSLHHSQLQLHLFHSRQVASAPWLEGCAPAPPCGLQVNAVKSQAVEGDKALIMADLIQVRLWALLWRALHCTGSNICSSSCVPSLHPGSCCCLSLTLHASAHPALSPAEYLLRRPQ